MHTSRRAFLLALVFTLIASSLLALDADAKRKRGNRHRENRSQIVQLAPKNQRPLSQLPELDLPVNLPEPSPCDPAEAALNGFLPETVTLKKTETYLAKLTVNKGASVLECDLSSGDFEVKFGNATLKTYGKVPYVGGWNHIASLSCSIRVSFSPGFSPPSTVVLSNLKVLAVNCENSPNWLDNSVVKDGLNAIFPSSISFEI
ncbi:MAG: hypothetical protein ACRDJC_11210 [Thermomicrobiales bacterium]